MDKIELKFIKGNETLIINDTTNFRKVVNRKLAVVGRSAR